VVIATSDHALQDPMVAWNGRDYLVVWQAESPTTRVRAIRGARVSPTGVVRDPAGLAIGGAAAYRQQFPVVAAAGERFVVAWEDGRVAPSGDLYVARVAADGTVLDPAGVHPFATFRTRTAAALSSDGARVLLGWQDGMGIPGGNGVYAALLGADGVAVGPGTLVDPQYRAFSLAFDGLHHLAAWRTDTGLAYTRLTPEGAPLPADRQQITGSFGSVFVASGGAGFQGITEGVRAFRLAASGAVTSAPAVISTSANAQSELRVASDGVGFVATWLDRGGAMAARVAPAGAVLDAPPLSVAAVASQLRVAFDGAAWLATWSNGGTAGAARIPAAGAVTPLTSAGGFVPPQFLGEGRGYVMATWLTRALGALLTGEVQRLSAPALTPGPRLAVTPQATTQNGVPVVAFDGTNHLVAWHEGTGLPPYCGYVSVLRVTPDGDRLDPMPLRLSPCLVADPGLRRHRRLRGPRQPRGGVARRLSAGAVGRARRPAQPHGGLRRVALRGRVGGRPRGQPRRVRDAGALHGRRRRPAGSCPGRIHDGRERPSPGRGRGGCARRRCARRRCTRRRCTRRRCTRRRCAPRRCIGSDRRRRDAVARR
jgi:hypothetical protein